MAINSLPGFSHPPGTAPTPHTDIQIGDPASLQHRFPGATRLQLNHSTNELVATNEDNRVVGKVNMIAWAESLPPILMENPILKNHLDGFFHDILLETGETQFKAQITFANAIAKWLSASPNTSIPPLDSGNHPSWF